MISVRMTPVTQPATPKYSLVMSATFHAWNMLPPVPEDIITQKENRNASKVPSQPSSGFIFFSARPATHIGPPCGLSGSSVFRYSMDNVTSTNLIDMPSKPTTHIQKMAPGPPSMMASATPLILPRPTVPESAADSAWKWLIAPGSSGSS